MYWAMDKRTTTNARLRALMKERGMSLSGYPKNKDLAVIANKLEVSIYTVRKWINGQRRMPLGYLKLLEKELEPPSLSI